MINISFKLNTVKLGFIIGALTFILTVFIFPLVFGETPVNILKLGSRVGEKNYLINITSYILISIGISMAISVISKKKLKWIKGVIFGTVITALLVTIYIVLYFEIFWRGKM